VNIFLRIENGRGMMRSMNSAISATRRRKTYEERYEVSIKDGRQHGRQPAS
jgi:hypothetical protein